MIELDCGIMIGSSADGIDIVLVDFDHNDLFKIYNHQTKKINTELQRNLILLGQSNLACADIPYLKQVEQELTRLLVTSLKDMLDLSDHEIKLRQVSVHGYTVIHSTLLKMSWQLIDPKLIFDEFNCPVVYDFRQSIIEAGGYGAPLIPLFHGWLTKKAIKEKQAAFVNIGGISNISICKENLIHGWDVGPGNCLIDQLSQIYFDEPYDRDGNYAAKGYLNKDFYNLLKNHLEEKKKRASYINNYPFLWFAQSDFTKKWLGECIAAINLQPYDALYTACYVTAESLNSYQDLLTGLRLMFFGGGVKNKTLMRMIQSFYPKAETQLPFGIDPDYMEAICFAWLGRQRLLQKKLNAEGLHLKNRLYVGEIYQDNKPDSFDTKINHLKGSA